MAAAPRVSVIVGAYNRQEYLPHAVRSLLAQTLPRDQFEVVVIKNFRSDALDRDLADAGVTVLFDDERQIGRWLRHAVRVARAPLVTFCDDDDEFEPDRLARIVEVFREHPDLGFYRNRVRVIDTEGQPIDPQHWRPHEVDAGLDEFGPVYRPANAKSDLLELVSRRTRATFATSTMALRRDLLDADLGDAFERTQLEDLFLLLTGVLSPYGLFLDDRRLTRYRFYAGNVTHTVGWLGLAAKSERDMADVASRHGRPDFAHWLCARALNHERLYLSGSLVQQVSTGTSRRDAALRTAEYLRFLGRHPEERRWTLDAWAAEVYGLSYLVLPPLARGVARARLAARAVN